MIPFFKIDKDIEDAAKKAQDDCYNEFKAIEEVVEYNQYKVQKAFIDNRISEAHFVSSTGYGYGDMGRETLDRFSAQRMLLFAIILLAAHTPLQRRFSESCVPVTICFALREHRMTQYIM
mgnify:CR=1 FL=1